MSTNFYWLKNPETREDWSENIDEDDPLRHIGKRSFAGAYCLECGVALSEHGTHSVHTHKSLENCPICGKSRKEVDGACSFTWTMMKHKRLLEELAEKEPELVICEDEYETEFTAKQMLEEADCVITYQDACRFF